MRDMALLPKAGPLATPGAASKAHAPSAMTPGRCLAYRLPLSHHEINFAGRNDEAEKNDATETEEDDKTNRTQVDRRL
jgi:hypothetical protein